MRSRHRLSSWRNNRPPPARTHATHARALIVELSPARAPLRIARTTVACGSSGRRRGAAPARTRAIVMLLCWRCLRERRQVSSGIQCAVEQAERFGVLDGVAVALLSQEKLPVGGEILVARVTCHNRVEVGRPPVRFGPQNAPQPLRLLLARAERAGDLD